MRLYNNMLSANHLLQHVRSALEIALTCLVGAEDFQPLPLIMNKTYFYNPLDPPLLMGIWLRLRYYVVSVLQIFKTLLSPFS